jgi:hypothetical protein
MNIGVGIQGVGDKRIGLREPPRFSLQRGDAL